MSLWLDNNYSSCISEDEHLGEFPLTKTQDGDDKKVNSMLVESVANTKPSLSHLSTDVAIDEIEPNPLISSVYPSKIPNLSKSSSTSASATTGSKADPFIDESLVKEDIKSHVSTESFPVSDTFGQVSYESINQINSVNLKLNSKTDDSKFSGVVLKNNGQNQLGELISPTEDSSEDHAEIDRTSTEASIENNKLDHDVVDSRTEDEAPDIDDDNLPLSGFPGPFLCERLLSVEITEGTDITTPIEMRDSHTEREDIASMVESGDGREKSTNSKCDTNEKEISDFEDDVVDMKVREGVQMTDSDGQSLGDAQVAEVFDSGDASCCEDPLPSKSEKNRELSGSSFDLHEKKSSMTSEYANVWPTEESRKARRTESTVVETGSNDECSPTDSKSRDPSFSDLLNSDEMNRDSLEDEFDKLVAEADSTPSSIPSLPVDSTVTESDLPSSKLPLSSFPSSSHQPTILEAGTILAFH